LGTAAARDGLGVDGSLLADTSMSSAQAREGTGFQTGHVFPVVPATLRCRKSRKRSPTLRCLGDLSRPQRSLAGEEKSIYRGGEWRVPPDLQTEKAAAGGGIAAAAGPAPPSLPAEQSTHDWRVPGSSGPPLGAAAPNCAGKPRDLTGLFGPAALARSD
jgi:hypothetical protein